MNNQTTVNPWWAVLTVWGLVNLVNILQAAGFISRVITGSRDINRLLGYGIVALGVPAILVIIFFVREKAGWQHWIGPAVFLVFLVFMIFVEDVWQIEFRSPMRYEILIPYLVLFYGSILLMGLPMFRINRGLWLITAITSAVHLAAMVLAQLKGVG
jgi:hypothetical protein